MYSKSEKGKKNQEHQQVREQIRKNCEQAQMQMENDKSQASRQPATRTGKSHLPSVYLALISKIRMK